MILVAVLALAAEPASSGSSDASAAVIANCNARKFETVVQTVRKGLPHSSKVTLCGHVGQSDADWARTLKDALRKVTADPKMSPAIKDQIVTALNIEIAKLPSAATPPSRAPQPVEGAPGIVAAPLVGSPSIAQAPSTLPKGGNGPRAEYSALPQFPPPPVASPAATASIAASAPLLPRLDLSMTCLNPNAMSEEGPCEELDRDTRLTVKAGEDIPARTSLRFMRRGDNRAEVELAGLQRGRSARMILPPEVCQGVVGSRVQVEVVRRPPGAAAQPQVVDSFGPFDLRC